MLEKAKKRLEDGKHISFIQGDVGDLPLADDILRRLYPEVEYHVDGSMVYFKCVKGTHYAG